MNNHELQAEEVRRYLLEHPEFFHDYPQLLESLSLPHPQNGNAVSLIKRQLHHFREQRDRYHVELGTMLDIAGENGQLFKKVMQLNASLMGAQSGDEALQVLKQQLQSEFRVDQSKIYSFDMPKRSFAGMQQLGMSAKWTNALCTLLTPKTPFCGALEKDWRQGLFDNGDSIHSVCILPLGEEKVWGILALGREDLSYENDFGHFFLRLMGEMVTAKFQYLFDNEEKAPETKSQSGSVNDEVRASLRIVPSGRE